jgi:predicted RNA-binding Zn-ribbon protein involved in translation (DUF1610 family)
MFDPESLPIPDLGLKCLSCGYHLAGLPRHICPECGRPIQMEEHIPPGEFPMLIFNGQYVMLANELRELLRRYAIPFMENKIYDEIVMMGPQAASSGRLCVPRERYFEVIDLLRRRMLGEPMPDVPDAAAGVEEWTCPGCGESNPGSFELCWNCQLERLVIIQ